jgi:hypothetical protein
MLLFGIPHRGLVVDDIQKILGGEDGHPRRVLLEQIRQKSDLLASQLDDFKNLVRDRKVVSFYETGQTRQLQFVRCCNLSKMQQSLTCVWDRTAKASSGQGQATLLQQ